MSRITEIDTPPPCAAFLRIYHLPASHLVVVTAFTMVEPLTCHNKYWYPLLGAESLGLTRYYAQNTLVGVHTLAKGKESILGYGNILQLLT